MDAFNFIEDPETRQVTCFVMPAATEELNAYKLRMALQQSEFKDLYAFHENVDSVIADAMAALASRARDSIDDDTQAAAPVALAQCIIAERRDGSIDIQISDDGMQADGVVTTTCGGTPIDSTVIERALTDAGVTQGIDAEAIQTLAKEAIESPGGLQVKRLLASGATPGPGIKSRFENLVVPFQDRVLKPREQDDGNIDMLDLGDIDTVEPGSPLVRREPAKPGKDGFTVRGDAITAEPPKETEFEVGEGTEISSDDSHLLIASVNGVPHRIRHGMSVDDVLQTGPVSLRTGHIDLDGNLLVKGDVMPEMKVRVTGNLTVLGFIEGAQVEAGGDITVRDGIIGAPPRDGQFVCSVSGRSIESKYAQNVLLKASQDIRLSSHLMHSDVFCHSLTVGRPNASNAYIMGGRIHAEAAVNATSIGADAGSRTEINFNRALADRQQRIEALQHEREQNMNTMTALSKPLQQLSALPKKPDIVEKINRIKNTIQQYLIDVTALEQQEKDLQAEIDQIRETCRITAWASFHAGVEFDCAGAHHKFVNDGGGATFGIRNGHWVVIADESAG